MDNWDEVRTALQVARLGTVSGAAEVLGVHHATVIRHVDALEGRLGVKLFQRHARGYTPTEAGLDLMRVAQTTDEQFGQLAGRIKGRGDSVSGELVVTSVTRLSSLLAPVMHRFQLEHPEIILRYTTGNRLYRLEYGEAHVAIRAGQAPDEPDNVVQPFVTFDNALFASRDYLARHGRPTGPEDYANHRFVCNDDRDTRAPFYRWLWQNVPEENIVFRSDDDRVQAEAVEAGIGIGFFPTLMQAPTNDLVQVSPANPDWGAPLWLVTHVDLHRTIKVQAFVNFLKEESKSWTMG
ncbi:LysR family transcriptional regulator [Poseidonocella sedimentorum]|uniref:DNA-binding transcriptional regulator, LysR family n=1 Tax=Poseidonocella sedimentorum TaxID=871652 RepID=A0A1I6DVW1_9RHOB|nr:LysR family transcriptional regulator [Poseidonocella sedimentorum]SFR09634.1 DNA-binding transcriptional regulator, LysR family [Poseidonocella sedimentorum]